MTRIIVVSGLLYALLGNTGLAAAQDTFAPVENDYVRVNRSVEKVGHKSGPHGHQFAKISIFLDAGVQTLVTVADDSQNVRTVTPGQVIYDGPVEKHISINPTNTDLRVLQVEFKKPADGSVPAVHAKDPLKIAGAQFTLLVDNPQVRVLRLTLKPGEQTPLYHRADRTTTVVLTPQHLKVSGESGPAAAEDRPQYDAYWQLAGGTQRLQNVGSEPFEAIVTEVKYR